MAASTRGPEKLAALAEDQFEEEDEGEAPNPFSFADEQAGGRPMRPADQEAQQDAARLKLQEEIDQLVRARLAEFSAAPPATGGAAAGTGGAAAEYSPYTPDGSFVDAQEQGFGFIDGSAWAWRSVTAV